MHSTGCDAVNPKPDRSITSTVCSTDSNKQIEFCYYDGDGILLDHLPLIREQIEEYCARKQSPMLICATRMWQNSDQFYYDRDRSQFSFIHRIARKPLSVARLRYGSEEQLILVEGPGIPRPSVIKYHKTLNNGFGSQVAFYKIWCGFDEVGEDFEKEASVLRVRKDLDLRTIIGDTETELMADVKKSIGSKADPKPSEAGRILWPDDYVENTVLSQNHDKFCISAMGEAGVAGFHSRRQARSTEPPRAIDHIHTKVGLSCGSKRGRSGGKHSKRMALNTADVPATDSTRLSPHRKRQITSSKEHTNRETSPNTISPSAQGPAFSMDALPSTSAKDSSTVTFHFVSADGNVSRTMPLEKCDCVEMLFDHAECAEISTDNTRKLLIRVGEHGRPFKVMQVNEDFLRIKQAIVGEASVDIFVSNGDVKS